MQQLSLIPVCEKHGVEKAWMRNRALKAGGQWKCKQCQKAFLDAWKARPGNQAKYDQQRREWELANPERRRAIGAKYRATHAEAERKRCARKKKAHKSTYAYLQRRRAARKLRCLVHLDLVDQRIAEAFYAKAQKDGLTVDHIQPLSLQGDHAPWNFQLLSLPENGRKGGSRPTLREVMRGERRYRLLRRMFERAGELGAVTEAA